MFRQVITSTEFCKCLTGYWAFRMSALWLSWFPNYQRDIYKGLPWKTEQFSWSVEEQKMCTTVLKTEVMYFCNILENIYSYILFPEQVIKLTMFCFKCIIYGSNYKSCYNKRKPVYLWYDTAFKDWTTSLQTHLSKPNLFVTTEMRTWQNIANMARVTLFPEDGGVYG